VRGDEKGEDILRAMDAAGLDLICIISWPPAVTLLELDLGKRPTDRERMERTGRMIASDPERIRAFYWLDPTAEDAADQVERAVADFRYSGVKLIPDHWHIWEERFFPVYERIQKMNVPVLFHVGILWGNADSSRFCRPADCEVMQKFPGVRFALAHVGWPWTDECIAVADRFKTMARIRDGRDPELKKDVVWRNRNLHNRQFEVDVQCKVDLTPGTPDAYRTEVLRRCCEVLGADMLLFGTDSGGADGLTGIKAQQERDERIFREELGLSVDDIDRIMGSNVLTLFGKA
jgi:predicted TIM-barrel fold metal-dependent hydrolase